jgi:hypothetical protein
MSTTRFLYRHGSASDPGRSNQDVEFSKRQMCRFCCASDSVGIRNVQSDEMLRADLNGSVGQSICIQIPQRDLAALLNDTMG